MTPPRASVRAFLSVAKNTLDNALRHAPQTRPPITFVIGNDSAGGWDQLLIINVEIGTDLDSILSAVLLAYVRTYTSSHTPPRIYIPLSNLPASDLAPRPELAPVLCRANLSANDLITLSSLPPINRLATHLPPQNTGWILVDHNSLQGTLGQLYGKQVFGCIDHHDEENAVTMETGDEPRVVKKSGSCASLIVEYCRDVWDKLSADQSSEDTATWDAELARLALGPILIDTTCLRSKDKTTSVDVSAVEYLESLIRNKEGKTYNRESYFSEISQAKENIGDLSLPDILRKDYKQWTAANDMKLGISAIVKPINFLLDKAGDEKSFLSICEEFAEKRDLDIFSIMTISHCGEEFMRELFIWALNGKGVETAKSFESDATEKLGLKAWGDGSTTLDLDSDSEKREEGWRRCWRQERTENSRKQVAPLLRSAVERSGRGESTSKISPDSTTLLDEV